MPSPSSNANHHSTSPHSHAAATPPKKGNHHHQHHHRGNRKHSHSPSSFSANHHPNITVILNRIDLYDTPQQLQQQQQQQPHRQGSNAGYASANSGTNTPDSSHHGPSFPSGMEVESFSFESPSSAHEDPVAASKLAKGRVHVTKVPPSAAPPALPQAKQDRLVVVMDNSVPNPYGPNIDKYWKQRRRLFSRFDEGIELDEEGWFSVTPEIIADHVAHRFCEMAADHHTSNSNSTSNGDTAGVDQPLVVLDAFCGCGGNAIAFAKQPNVTVIATDIDRSKLRKAAHNAAIYQIPPHKILFVECNVLFLLEFCFRNGEYILDQPIATPEHINALLAAMPPPVPTETVDGYSIGGIDLLPRHIDAVFMDPPWGGVDYEVFGKHGYCLEKNMRIKRPTAATAAPEEAGAPMDDFFDSFQPRTKQERKSQFNVGLDDTNCVNGVTLLRLAATATARRWVIYDIPRNTNRTSLGGAALTAGYRGNVKLEEHYLNGRLKTVTAYMGTDWTHLLTAEQSKEGKET